MAIKQERMRNLIVAGINFRDAFYALREVIDEHEQYMKTQPETILSVWRKFQVAAGKIQFQSEARDISTLNREHDHFKANFRGNERRAKHQRNKREEDRNLRSIRLGREPPPPPTPVFQIASPYPPSQNITQFNQSEAISPDFADLASTLTATQLEQDPIPDPELNPVAAGEWVARQTAARHKRETSAQESITEIQRLVIEAARQKQASQNQPHDDTETTDDPT
jgi:hypothetical protein